MLRTCCAHDLFRISKQSQKTICVKFMFSKKATKIDEIFTIDLTLCSKCQIDGEHFVNFCDIFSVCELYKAVLKQFV